MSRAWTTRPQRAPPPRAAMPPLGGRRRRRDADADRRRETSSSLDVFRLLVPELATRALTPSVVRGVASDARAIVRVDRVHGVHERIVLVADDDAAARRETRERGRGRGVEREEPTPAQRALLALHQLASARALALAPRAPPPPLRLLLTRREGAWLRERGVVAWARDVAGAAVRAYAAAAGGRAAAEDEVLEIGAWPPLALGAALRAVTTGLLTMREEERDVDAAAVRVPRRFEFGFEFAPPRGVPPGFRPVPPTPPRGPRRARRHGPPARRGRARRDRGHREEGRALDAREEHVASEGVVVRRARSGLVFSRRRARFFSISPRADAVPKNIQYLRTTVTFSRRASTGEAARRVPERDRAHGRNHRHVLPSRVREDDAAPKI